MNKARVPHNKLPDEMRQQIVARYVAGESCPEIADFLGISVGAAWSAVQSAGAGRSHSEAMALRFAKYPSMAEKRGKVSVFHSAKCMRWIPTGSTYEYLRMEQLENDPSVASFSRCRDRIQYELDGVVRFYLPDIEVLLIDGCVRVEEVKPNAFISSADVVAKTQAALEFYAILGKSFVVITEDEIGWDRIRNFDGGGLSSLSDEALAEVRREREKERQRKSKAAKLAAMSAQERAEHNRRQSESYFARTRQATQECIEDRRRKNREAQRRRRQRLAQQQESQGALI